MKKNLLIIIFMTSTVLIFGQDITGDWYGALKVQSMQLRLVFHITKTDSAYKATMDSPDQGAKDIPMSKASFENNLLTLELAAAYIKFTGKTDSTGAINGTFNQGGQSFPLTLTRKTIGKIELKRPQNPVLPYPYYSENVTFENTKEHFKLAGTLTLPAKEGKYPVVVLITGSGPQNRDEELMGHKPFLVLSDYLTRKGIGVLRYDDRGTFASKGNFAKSTTFDFATDVESAVSYLRTRKEIDQKHIGLIGHSEGGIIAPMVAVTDKNISFIVLMAGTGISGGDLLLLQQEAIGHASGISEDKLKEETDINSGAFKIVDQSTDSATVSQKLTEFLNQKMKENPNMDIPKGAKVEDIIHQQVVQVSSPWMMNFIKYNPAPTLEKVKCYVLALNGSKDLQVPSKVNLPAIENALKKGGNKKYTIKELPGLNHLFQECTTGLPKEYSEIEQTISPIALETMTNWIKEIIK
jgi:hypothetical protein